MRAMRWLCTSALGAALAACGGGSGGGNTPPVATGPIPTPKSLLALKNFSAADNCAEFRSYTADALTEQYLQPFYRCPPGALIACPVFLGPPTGVDQPGAPNSAGEGAFQPGRVSGTNTQEAGVDEADIVKADSAGNIYILAGKNLFVLDAFPPAGLADRPLVTLDLSHNNPSFYASDLFLDEATQRLVVLGQSYDDQGGRAVSAIVDVSDPSAPVEVKRLAVDGYALESRRIDSRVHRVSRFDVPLPAWFYDPGDPLNAQRVAYLDAQNRGDTASADQIKASVRADIGNRVDAAGAEAFLPHVRDGATATVLACDAVARPEVPEGLGLVVIDSFNSDGTSRATSAAVNNAWMIYASANNLYLAQSSWGWRWDVDQAEETAIYRFALSDTGPAVYQGVGKVPGSIGGAYALSEFAGNLRVASTETRFTSTKPETTTVSTYNQLNVLRANQPNADLSVIGAVNDFAPGERIQGVRFVGPRGYVVTFRQIDPLFAFDLSDAAHPAIASQLSMPGFSSYLAPIGDDYLLTVGREGEDTGQLTGRMQISLFDVHDPANVQRVDQLVPANQPQAFWSYSAAEYDPHAFTYFPDDPNVPQIGTLAVPLQSFGESFDDTFAGFVVVRVNAHPAASAQPGASLIELGRVDHSALADDRFCSGETPPPSPDGSPQPVCEPGIFAADPRRAVFMQDPSGPIDLYTISLVGVVAVDASAPSDVLGTKLLPYDPPAFDYCCVVAGGGGSGSGGGTAPPPSGP